MGVTRSNVARVSGSNSTFAGTVRITGGPNVTVGTDASGISISGAAQTAQTGISSIGASNTTYTSGGVTLTGSNMVTVRSTTGQGIVIDATQSVQTQDVLSAGVSTGGNTAGNTTVNTGSRFVIAGAGMVTANQATAAGATTVSLSATQSVQTQDVLSIGATNAGNTAGNTTVNTGSRFVLVGTNNITVSQGTAAGATTITLSGPNTNPSFSGGVSTAGNTAGSTGVTGTRLVLVGTNNISLSQSTDANGATVSINQTGGGGGFSAGVSTGGNTAGSTGATGTQLILVGSANITLSQSTGANGGTVSIIGPTPGAAQYSIGVSTGGNTAGSTGVTGTRIVFVGTGGNTLSQSTDATGATISINAGANTISQFVMNHQAGLAISNITNFTATGVTQRPMLVPFELDDYVVWDDMYIEVSRATTGSDAMTLQAAIYSFVNSTQISRLASLQNVHSATATASNSGLRHIRLQGMETAGTSLTPGPYVMLLEASAGNTASMNYSIRGWSTAGIAGVLASGTDNRSTASSQLSSIPTAGRFGGRWTTTTASPPATIAFSDVQHFTSYVPYWFRLAKTG